MKKWKFKWLAQGYSSMAVSGLEPKFLWSRRALAYLTTALLSNIHSKSSAFSFETHLSWHFNKEVFASYIEHKFTNRKIRVKVNDTFTLLYPFRGLTQEIGG